MSDATLRPYDASWRDKLAVALMGDGRASPERRRLVEGVMGSSGLGQKERGLIEFSPMSIPLGLQESGILAGLFGLGAAQQKRSQGY